MIDSLEKCKDERFDFYFKILEKGNEKPNKELVNKIYNDDVIPGNLNQEEAMLKYFNIKTPANAMQDIKSEMENKPQVKVIQEEKENNNTRKNK